MTIRRLSPELILIIALLAAFGAGRVLVSRTAPMAAHGPSAPPKA